VQGTAQRPPQTAPLHELTNDQVSVLIGSFVLCRHIPRAGTLRRNSDSPAAMGRRLP